MSRDALTMTDTPKRFPRVSGDEPLIRWDAQEAVLFSPRERG